MPDTVTLVSCIESLAQRIGVECRTLAAAILQAKVDVKNDLLGGASDAFDTLKELADLISTNADAITALQNLAAGHVKFSESQPLTDTQKTTALTNIGAAAANNVVTKTAQVLTAEEKAQIRTNIGAISATDVAELSDVILSTAQSLEDSEKAQARTNIDAADINDVVKLSAQTLDTAAKTQARNNISAASSDDVSTLGSNSVQVVEQSFTTTQMNQACTNIGAMPAASIGDPTTDFVSIFEAALVNGSTESDPEQSGD